MNHSSLFLLISFSDVADIIDSFMTVIAILAYVLSVYVCLWSKSREREHLKKFLSDLGSMAIKVPAVAGTENKTKTKQSSVGFIKEKTV